MLAMITFVGCDSDRDSNPILTPPTEFVLNTPKYVNATYDLADTESILLTCSQPDYGYAAPATYEVIVSASGDFTDAITLPTTYQSARMDVHAQELAVALVTQLNVSTAEEFPTTAFPVYLQLKSSIKGIPGETEILSNIIMLPSVKSYFALEEMSLPTEMFIIGDFYAWDWEKAAGMVPVNGNPDKFWVMTYIGEGQGIKFNTVRLWNGTQFGGGDNVTINTREGFTHSINGDGNIVMDKAGWHLIMLTVAIEGRDYVYTVDFLEPNVYVFGAANGGIWASDPAWKCEVPADGAGEFVSPALVATPGTEADGSLRLCVELPDIDWWRSEFIIFGEVITYRATGGDQERVGNGDGQKVYLNFLTNQGRIE